MGQGAGGGVGGVFYTVAAQAALRSASLEWPKNSTTHDVSVKARVCVCCVPSKTSHGNTQSSEVVLNYSPGSEDKKNKKANWSE